MKASSLRKGTAILFQNEIHIVVDFSHHTPGNKRGFIQASMKNLKAGRIVQNKFGSDDEVERAILEPRKCQFLYKDDEGFHFMDMEDYHNFPLSDDIIGDGKFYLKENMELSILFHDGSAVIPEFPKSVVLKVTEAPPWVKGDSVSNNTKPVVCETGLKLLAPIFIKEGEEINVNTDTGQYGGRA